MKRITKRVLLEEIQRINEIIGVGPKSILNEQPTEFIEKLFRGGEEEVSNVVKTIEKSGIKGADDVASAFRNLVEKGLTKLTEEESLFLANVIRQIYPDVAIQVRRSLTNLLIPNMGPVRVGKLENILANEKYETDRLYNYLVNNLGMENLTVLELQVWRDALKRTPSEIKIPTTVEPRPENAGQSVELSPIVVKEMETAIDNELGKLQGQTGIANPEIPFVTDISDPQATEFISKKMSENGIDPNQISPKDLLNTMNELISSNRAAAEAVTSSSNAVREAIQHTKTNPSTTPTTEIKNVNPTIIERVKKLWNADKKTIDNYNIMMTCLQLASICIDVYGTHDGKFSEYSNPFYGKNLGFWETMGIKVLARGIGGKALFGINIILTAVDAIGMGYDLGKYHPERMKKLSDEEKAAIQKKKDDAEKKRQADSLYNAEKDRLRKVSLDSLKQKFSDDSLINAIRNKMKSKDKLDNSGKEQIIDPFKQ